MGLGLGCEFQMSIVSLGTLYIERYSTVGGGNLLPAFLFLQGESDGLSQELGLSIGGGHGKPVPFVPDDSCDDAIFDGASPDLRSPILPYLKQDTWGCERTPAELPTVLISSTTMEAEIVPQFGGKLWGLRDKFSGRDFFFRNPAHQPANIGARGAWAAGGLEFNWAPGYLGHSAFTEERVWSARLQTVRGEMVRIWEFDRYNATVFQVDVLLDGDELWTHTKVTNPSTLPVLGYWWTCAAHKATPGTRILAPAPEVTVETFVGSALRNAPWPYFDNGMLNSTFGGQIGRRLVDSSYLGNIACMNGACLECMRAHPCVRAHLGARLECMRAPSRSAVLHPNADRAPPARPPPSPRRPPQTRATTFCGSPMSLVAGSLTCPTTRSTWPCMATGSTAPSSSPGANRGPAGSCRTFSAG